MWPREENRTNLNPYNLRVQSLDRLLSPEEFGIALFHTVRRRGYVPRGEGWIGGQPAIEGEEPSSGPLATAATRNEMRLAQYRTSGEMLARDPNFAEGKRNRPGDYRAALSRPMVEQEVAQMFVSQRRFGSTVAGEGMQQAVEDLAFSQLPRRYPAMNRPCPYLPSERLGPRRAPTMERYAFLDQLTKIRLIEGGMVRRLTALEISRAAERFGRTVMVTRLDLRRWLALGAHVRFAGGRREDADIVAYKGAAYGTVSLRNILGRAVWTEISALPRQSDALAAAVTFSNDPVQLAQHLASIPLSNSSVTALQEAFEDGELDGFRGTGRVSTAAAARMIPHLLEGHLVFDAAIKAGFNPLARDQHILHAVRSPRVVKPVLEVMKQIHAFIAEQGIRPGRIHVEVTRDLGLTPEQRTAAQESYRKIKQASRTARETLSEILPGRNVTGSMVERYMLWQEQGGLCAYTGEPIDMQQLLDGAVVSTAE